MALALICTLLAIAAAISASRSNRIASTALETILMFRRDIEELRKEKKAEELKPVDKENQLAADTSNHPVARIAEKDLVNPVPQEDDPIILAVISAAIHTVIQDKEHRILSVRQITPGWAIEGRRQIFSSHNTR